MSNITELPRNREQANPNEAIYPTYYYADTDEVAIPRLPADPDTACAIIGSWVRLLVICKVLTPSQAIEAAQKGAGKEGAI
jgi:hypothetical protein